MRVATLLGWWAVDDAVVAHRCPERRAVRQGGVFRDRACREPRK